MEKHKGEDRTGVRERDGKEGKAIIRERCNFITISLHPETRRPDSILFRILRLAQGAGLQKHNPGPKIDEKLGVGNKY